MGQSTAFTLSLSFAHTQAYDKGCPYSVAPGLFLLIVKIDLCDKSRYALFMRRLTTVAFSIGLLLTLVISNNNSVHAQNFTTGQAVAISTEDTLVPSGSIIINNNGVYTLSTQPSDILLFGVTNDSPSTYIDDGTAENKHLIVTHGETMIRVTNSNGAIQEGDFLTSSTRPGIAQKATETGQIIGTALDAFDQDEGTILAFVEVRTQYIPSTTTVNLFTGLRSAINTPFITPLVSLRYILAALLILISIILGFLNFRRISGSSIEALGRNPLAQKSIRATVILNFFITGLIITTGVVLAVIILIL